MTTFAAPHDAQRHRAELDALTRAAWADYREVLRDLEGPEYVDLEAASWEQLQAQLRELSDQRALLGAAIGGSS